MMKTRRAFLRDLMVAAVTTPALSRSYARSAVERKRKPNMVVFLSDDHGCLDSPVYGGAVVRTPTMQKLAAHGMVFDRAFVASPACGPSRAALLSGLMPARNGAEPNHTLPRPETQTMVKLLQEQGYEVVAFGKVAHGRQHPQMVGFDHWQDARREQIAKLVKRFLARRTSDKPLCLMVGDHRPHVRWIAESSYDPDEVVLPEHFIDTKQTREHWARYLTDVTGMDATMAEVDRLAREHFATDDYLFLYTADHGAQWPFGKWNLYDAGVRTPMIVRWPGKIAPGIRTEAMVSWIDVMPTLLELAGGTVPEHIDGRSFADVLLGRSKEHRDVIYTTHSGDGIMNVYPIRAVRTGQFKYIRNLRPDCYHSNHSDILRKDGAGAYWDSWDEAAQHDPKAAAVVAKYYRRPPVEFYDLTKDPTEQHNLGNDRQYAEQIKKMSTMLDEWMRAQGDTQQVFREPYPTSGPRPRVMWQQRNRNQEVPGNTNRR
ncbi:MAG: sulfatase [Phycisphaerales bacterium]|nr:MAG: sulfatase [Phycisphaerales bacterium]